MTAPPRRAAGQRGFTLIEVLVALAVLAVLAVMAYGGLRQVMVARDRLVDSDRRLAAVQKAMLIMNADFALAAARGVRDESDRHWPALTGGADSDPQVLLRLTRAGRPNPAGLRQSGLERVVYRLRDGRLERLVWPTLDRSSRTSPSPGVLLEHVKRVRLRFLQAPKAGGGPGPNWLSQWPVAGAASAEDTLPAGLELDLRVEGLGRLHRVFAVGGRG